MWRRWRAEFEQTRREAAQRHDEWLRQFEKSERDWRAKHAAFLAEQKRRFDAIDAAMENDKRVTRDMLLELRQGRETLRDIQDGIRANTEALLRVLDEMRRDDGPNPAGA
jgi:hypothetical protein